MIDDDLGVVVVLGILTVMPIALVGIMYLLMVA
jgi:hypothetical protein